LLFKVNSKQKANNTRHPQLVTRYPMPWACRVMTHFEFRIPQSEFRNSQVSLTENTEPSVLQPAKGGSLDGYLPAQK